MRPSREESLPLVNDGQDRQGKRGQQVALGATAAYLIALSVLCLPRLVELWHPVYYSTLNIEVRGWTWLGANALWLALSLLWTLFHIDNGPCVATACLLCSVCWAYMDVVLISQAIRRQLPLLAVANFALNTTLLVLCARATWRGVARPRKAPSDGTATWRRVFRKWALVVASVQLVLAFIACWPTGLPLTTLSGRESAPWEWNSAVLLVMALALLWAAFLTRGGLVDETKGAACAWCTLVFGGGFILCTFSWWTLGLDGYSITTSVVLAVDFCVFAVAACV